MGAYLATHLICRIDLPKSSEALDSSRSTYEVQRVSTPSKKRKGLRLTAACCVTCVWLAVSIQGCRHEEGADAARISIKTSLPQGVEVAEAKHISFADIAAMPEPPGVQKNDPHYQNARIPEFPNPLDLKEGDVITFAGYLHRVTYMGDGDYNLRLSASFNSADNYIVSEIPDDDDVQGNLRPMVVSARDFLKSNVLAGKDPSRDGTVLDDPPYVEITGQLYFGDSNIGNLTQADKLGMHRASNWQVHPGLIVAVSKPGS